MTAFNAFLVFIGAGLGGLLRWVSGLVLGQPAWLPFAAPTLFVNAVGGLLAGVLFGLFGATWLRTEATGLFLMTGVLGGLTTFSSFTAEGAQLMFQRPWLALAHAVCHVGICLLLFVVGLKIVQCCSQGSP
ncbi:MAG: fluoride efflux transporter FluC [Limnobacter sp.]|uniref:fluoride efflux transporter FluC n=1 Tax=Limnobacter sp. TaxID=2003368 RepID=UPI00391D26A4